MWLEFARLPDATHKGERLTVDAVATHLDVDQRIARLALLRAHAELLVERQQGFTCWVPTEVPQASR